MSSLFTIMGRGRAGRALAASFGDNAGLVSHAEAPDGLVLLAVPDRMIAEQAQRFLGRCVHMSGSLHWDHVPCVHPLTSFDGEARDFSGVPLACTGVVPDVILSEFVRVGFVPFSLLPEHKALYHAVAVLSSGHAATLWIGALQLLTNAGIVLPGRGLWPLVEATVDNIAAHGATGRTGPFVRGDEATVERDASVLPPSWREVFLKLGRL